MVRSRNAKRYHSMIEVREVFAWTKPGCSPVAIHCAPPAGYVRASQGFRIYRNGKVLFPSYPGFKTREEAEAKAAKL